MTLTCQLLSVCSLWAGGPSLFSMAVYTHENNATIQMFKCTNICVLNEQSIVVGALLVTKALLPQYSWETKTDL